MFPRAGISTRSTCSSTPSRAHRSAQKRSSSAAAARRPWLTCSACTRAAPSSSSGHVQQADGVGAARDHHQHAGSMPGVPLPADRVPLARAAAVTRSIAPLDISRILRRRGWRCAARATETRLHGHRVRPPGASSALAPCARRSRAADRRRAALATDRERSRRRRAGRGRPRRAGGDLHPDARPSAAQERAVGRTGGEIEQRIESIDGAVISVEPDRTDRSPEASLRERSVQARRAQLRRPRRPPAERPRASQTSGACATSATSAGRPAPTSAPRPPGTSRSAVRSRSPWSTPASPSSTRT